MSPTRLQWLVVAVVVFMVELATMAANLHINPELSAVWPSAGVAMAAIMLLGPKIASAIFVGAALRSFVSPMVLFDGDMFTGTNVFWSLTTPLPNLACYLGSYYLLHRAGELHKTFDSVRSTIRFLFIAVTLMPAIAGLAEISLSVSVGLTEPNQWRNAWIGWYFSEVNGIALVASMIIAVVNPASRRRLVESWPMTLAALVSTCINTLIAFTPTGQLVPGLAITALAAWAPLAAWGAVSGGLLGGGLIVSVGALLAVAAMGTTGSGPFPVNHPNDILICLQAYLVMLTASMLITASVATEKEHEHTKLQASRDEATQARDRLRRLSKEMATTETHRNRQIAESLHDGISQDLALVQAKLSQSITPTNKTELNALMHLQQAISKTRQVVFELSPPTLTKLGLTPAIKSLARMTEDQHDVIVNVKTDPPNDEPLSAPTPRPPAEIEAFVFRTVRELIINSIKHALPEQIGLTIHQTPRSLQIEFEDDGPGFDLEQAIARDRPDSGFGLLSINEFALTLNGRLFQPKSQPNQLVLEIPLETSPHDVPAQVPTPNAGSNQLI